MFKTVNVSYVYAVPKTWDRYMLACDELGWSKSTLLTQLLHSFGSVALSYYQEAAEMDAIARGFESSKGEHFSLLRDWAEMPRYTETQPAFERSPLADIPDVDTSTENRKSFNHIRCSARNSVILHLATIVERSNVPQTLSRIMLWHFDRYWDKAYLHQLEADKQQTLSPDI